MKKLNFKEYIKHAKINFDNTVTISYSDSSGILYEFIYHYVRDLKITRYYISVDNIIIKFEKNKNMDIKIVGNLERVNIEDGRNVIDFGKSNIQNFNTENLSCGDIHANTLTVGNNVDCSDIKSDKIVTKNGNILAVDIQSTLLQTNHLNCSDVVATDIIISKNGSRLSCGDISGNVTGSDVDINCCDIGGYVFIKESGDVNCTDIGGDLTTNNGKVSCGDVFGNMITNNLK